MGGCVEVSGQGGCGGDISGGDQMNLVEW